MRIQSMELSGGDGLETYLITWFKQKGLTAHGIKTFGWRATK
jgi:hypothetical protein